MPITLNGMGNRVIGRWWPIEQMSKVFAKEGRGVGRILDKDYLPSSTRRRMPMLFVFVFVFVFLTLTHASSSF